MVARFGSAMTNIRSLRIKEKADAPKFASTAVAAGVVIYVELPEELRDQEASRLEKEIARLVGERTRLESKLSNESFSSKAPAAVIDKERAKLAAFADEERKLQEKLDALRA